VPIDSGRFDWAGAYAGIHASYGSGEFDGIYDNANDVPPGYQFSDLDPNGWGVGGHIGYNYVQDNVLFGIEADATYLHLNDDDLYVEIQGANPSDPMGGEIDLVYSVRGRLGVISDAWMFYGTGGVAWANYEVTTTNTFNGLSGSQSHSDHGWVIGAGAEYAINANWIARFEYLHYEFNGSNALVDNVFSTDVDAGDNVGLDNIGQVRFGVSYKF